MVPFVTFTEGSSSSSGSSREGSMEPSVHSIKEISGDREKNEAVKHSEEGKLPRGKALYSHRKYTTEECLRITGTISF